MSKMISENIQKRPKIVGLSSVFIRNLIDIIRIPLPMARFTIKVFRAQWYLEIAR